MKLVAAALALAVAAAPALAQEATGSQSAPPVATQTGNDPVGGYAPPPAPPPPPDATVQFQPSASPSVAFPPPAPLAEYPVCKRGQYDKCRQLDRRK